MKTVKKIIALAMGAFMAAGLTACGGKTDVPVVSEESAEAAQTGQEAQDKLTLTLWTYPVGSWGNSTTVSNLVADFNRKYPNYNVNVEYLEYEDGDAKVSEAIDNGTLPDLVLEGPERLVANWGDKGVMVDLSDLWESETASQIYEPVRNACRHRNGAYYEFPICMTAHCMAINYDMFEAAGALQYIDEENRTWSTDDFVHAVEALKNYGQEKAGIVYCGNQGGDQGTRALVNNLYGGKFANEDHTGYLFNSEENIRALQLLRDMDGIAFDPASVGSDEVEQFAEGELAMAFCWNVSMEVTQTVNHPDIDFDIFPMSFPADDGEPTLQGGIWGFGVFDNGDEARVEAAKKFIQFFTEDDIEYSKAVMTAGYWPVREMPKLYANDDIMREYGIFTQYMGDYYQVTPGWAEVRTAWWNMLQHVGSGADIAEEAAAFDAAANQAAADAMAEQQE